MDLSKSGMRWAIFAIVLVALVLAGVGVAGSTRSAKVAVPTTVCVMEPCAVNTTHILVYRDNGSLFAPERSRYWYFGGGAVLVLGLIGVWAASARRRGRSES